MAREVEATDDVLGDADAVLRFIGDALPRFGGRLTPDPKKPGVHVLEPGELPRLLGGAFPFASGARVVLDRAAGPDLPCLGRTHPAVAALADAVLGQAFEGGERPLFARAGAMLTAAVERVTSLLLLRLRYTLDEGDEQAFAEEVRLVAIERRDGSPVLVEPVASAALDLAARAAPAGNLEAAERTRYVDEAQRLLDATPSWWRSLVDARKAEIETGHRRLRRITGEGRFAARPHTPPDIMACFVLVPAVRGPR